MKLAKRLVSSFTRDTATERSGLTLSLVVDASVVLARLFPDENSTFAQSVIRGALGERPLAAAAREERVTVLDTPAAPTSR